MGLRGSGAGCGTRGSLRTMHGGGSAPSCCAFTHRVAFEEGSGAFFAHSLPPGPSPLTPYPVPFQPPAQAPALVKHSCGSF